MTELEEAAAAAKRAVSLVEQSITGLGIDPQAGKTERAGHVAFALRRGSARILIAVHSPSEALQEGRIRVVSPVVRLPPEDKQLVLYRWLLQANAAELVGAAFAISGEEIVVVCERGVTDLDASEVDTMIRTVGRLADKYDDELSAQFGAARSSDG